MLWGVEFRGLGGLVGFLGGFGGLGAGFGGVRGGCGAGYGCWWSWRPVLDAVGPTGAFPSVGGWVRVGLWRCAGGCGLARALGW